MVKMKSQRVFLSGVDVLPVPKLDDHDDEDFIDDGVDNSMVPDAYAQAWSALECSSSGWPRIMCEECDCAANAIAILLRDTTQ
jgi:hypothetical protein